MTVKNGVAAPTRVNPASRRYVRAFTVGALVWGLVIVGVGARNAAKSRAQWKPSVDRVWVRDSDGLGLGLTNAVAWADGLGNRDTVVLNRYLAQYPNELWEGTALTFLAKSGYRPFDAAAQIIVEDAVPPRPFPVKLVVSRTRTLAELQRMLAMPPSMQKHAADSVSAADEMEAELSCSGCVEALPRRVRKRISTDEVKWEWIVTPLKDVDEIPIKIDLYALTNDSPALMWSEKARPHVLLPLSTRAWTLVENNWQFLWAVGPPGPFLLGLWRVLRARRERHRVGYVNATS